MGDIKINYDECNRKGKRLYFILPHRRKMKRQATLEWKAKKARTPVYSRQFIYHVRKENKNTLNAIGQRGPRPQ